jgi:hypothetical protein
LNTTQPGRGYFVEGQGGSMLVTPFGYVGADEDEPTVPFWGFVGGTATANVAGGVMLSGLMSTCFVPVSGGVPRCGATDGTFTANFGTPYSGYVVLPGPMPEGWAVPITRLIF